LATSRILQQNAVLISRQHSSQIDLVTSAGLHDYLNQKMATAAVDVDYLSGYLHLPQDTLATALDAPTAELVRSVLEAVTVKAREHDVLVADKYRVDIELENAVRSSETRIEGLRASVEQGQKTVEEVRTKLKEEGYYASIIQSMSGVC
jgi:nucleoprotein TPR